MSATCRLLHLCATEENAGTCSRGEIKRLILTFGPGGRGALLYSQPLELTVEVPLWIQIAFLSWYSRKFWTTGRLVQKSTLLLFSAPLICVHSILWIMKDQTGLTGNSKILNHFFFTFGTQPAQHFTLHNARIEKSKFLTVVWTWTVPEKCQN